MYLFAYLIFQNFFFPLILGVVTSISVTLYLSEKERTALESKDQGINLTIYESDYLPNTVLLEKDKSLYAFTGFLFLSTIDEDISVATLRLQSQFGICQSYSQLGSTYLLFYKYEMTSLWENVVETKQTYILQQVKQHMDNFQETLQDMIPGVKLRFLTSRELKHELALGPSLPIPLVFQPSTEEKNELDPVDDTDIYEVPAITPNLTLK